MKEFEKILVTGASQGIGREIAIEIAKLLGDKAELVLSYCSNHLLAEDVAMMCRKYGAKVKIVELNLNYKESIRHLLCAHPDCTALINNAGILYHDTLLMQREVEFEKMLTVNLCGTLELTKGLLESIHTIVTLGSDATIFPRKNLFSYSLVKTALRSAMHCLKEDFPEKSVYFVNPGQTATAMSGKIGQPPNIVGDAIAQLVAGKLILPKNVIELNVGPVFNSETPPQARVYECSFSTNS